MSTQRVVDIVRDVLELPLRLGTAINIVRRAQPRFDAAAQAILAMMRDRAVVGSDETGARVAGRNAWQWVFQTPDSVYFTIEPRRNAAGCLLYVWLVATGEHVLAKQLFAEVDRSDRRDLSIFRLGWDFIERRLALHDPFPDVFVPNFCSSVR